MLVIATARKPLALRSTNITLGGLWVIMKKFGNIGQCRPQIPVGTYAAHRYNVHGSEIDKDIVSFVDTWKLRLKARVALGTNIRNHKRKTGRREAMGKQACEKIWVSHVGRSGGQPQHVCLSEKANLGQSREWGWVPLIGLSEEDVGIREQGQD